MQKCYIIIKSCSSRNQGAGHEKNVKISSLFKRYFWYMINHDKITIFSKPLVVLYSGREMSCTSFGLSIDIRTDNTAKFSHTGGIKNFALH